MIIDGKRHQHLSVYKKKEAKAYFMVALNEDTMYVVSTFWANVTTEDLEAKPIMSRRFFQRTVREDEPLVSEFARGDYFHTTNASFSYPVSWNKTPKVWRELFKKVLDEHGWFEQTE